MEVRCHDSPRIAVNISTVAKRHLSAFRLCPKRTCHHSDCLESYRGVARPGPSQSPYDRRYSRNCAGPRASGRPALERLQQGARGTGGRRLHALRGAKGTGIRLRSPARPRADAAAGSTMVAASARSSEGPSGPCRPRSGAWFVQSVSVIFIIDEAAPRRGLSRSLSDTATPRFSCQTAKSAIESMNSASMSKGLSAVIP